MKSYYFAYNSDMLLDVIEEKLGKVKDLGIATTLDTWTVDYSKLGSKLNIKDSNGNLFLWGYANLRQLGTEADRQIHGVLYRLSDEQFKRQDMYKGRPAHYRRRPIDITHNGKYKRAEAYVSVETQEGLKPKQFYLEHMVRGAMQHNMSQEYTTYLMRHGFISDLGKKKQKDL